VSEALAIEGGRPVRDTLLPYGRHAVGEEDVQAVLAALRSDWLTTGPRVPAFERLVAAAAGAAHAVAVSSGTAALHAAMAAAGVGPGDEVIVPALTFAATANAAVYQGAAPVFADVRPDTLNADPASVAARLTPRTRAIVAVDYAGQPADLDQLAHLARDHGAALGRETTLVEDAAHALGAEVGGRRVGAIADLTTFSFHPVKHATAGEGGAVTTDRAELAERMRRFRNHGLETSFRERDARGLEFSPMVELGFNYRLSDLQCALGASQLGRLEEGLKRRAEIAQRYRAELAGEPGLRLPAVAPDVRHAWHIFPALLDLERLTADRRGVLAALRAENVGAAVHYVPVYWHPFYARRGYARGLCPVAEDAFARLVTLPLFPSMTDADAGDVVAAVRKVLGRYRR
jgi:perosamine synthetase